MQDQRPPVAPDQQVGIQDDTQVQILRELKRQNALLEEQLAPQREQKRKQEAYRIQMEKKRQFRGFIRYWEKQISIPFQEKHNCSQQLSHITSPSRFDNGAWLLYTNEMRARDAEIAKTLQEKIQTLQEKIDKILKEDLNGKYKLDITYGFSSTPNISLRNI